MTEEFSEPGGNVHFHTAADPAKPRTRAVRVLATLTVVLLLAAGGFATLWLLERSDHKATNSQLGTARTKADGSEARLIAAEARVQKADVVAEQAANDRQTMAAERDKESGCAAAGRAMAAAITSKNVKAADEAGKQLVLMCPAP
jgi:hypothetical protein